MILDFLNTIYIYIYIIYIYTQYCPYCTHPSYLKKKSFFYFKSIFLIKKCTMKADNVRYYL